ncbi:MAG: AAA family ATPase [Acidimicrobiia bacterium]
MTTLRGYGGSGLLKGLAVAGTVAVKRERHRRKRLRALAIVLAPVAAWMWWRILTGDTPWPHMPDLGPDVAFWLPGILIILLLGVVLVAPMLLNQRSPHITFRPEEIDVSFADVHGADRLKEEIRHTLEVLLDYKRFRDDMGGSPRRGILFEGPPGTGKTYMAKAMAREAEVPFLFVSATAFQSMWYGMTARKIRKFFKDLRKAARAEGGAIGFIEEIDAIGLSRSGVSSASGGAAPAMTVNQTGISQETGGMVNELLIQMQSFDTPPFSSKAKGVFKDLLNRYLPPERQLKKDAPEFTNILLIAATNRAAALDPALMRPGRFDRVLHFDLPSRTARLALIDYFLGKKSHEAELDDQDSRDELAAATLGYTPASLERLFDEALLLALRDGRGALSTADLWQARMEIEIGLPEPLDQPEHERRTIATHEAGHATVAYLVGKGRKLEVLSIIKRKQALGFLAHRLLEERHTQQRSEMLASIQIAFGGMVAEELFFDESGSGPAGDLAAATSIAVEMVGSMGLGGSLISFRAMDGGPLAGNLAASVLADEQGREAVERLLAEQKQEVTTLLAGNRHIIESLRDQLLERNELVDDEITDVIEKAMSSEPGQIRTIIDLRDEDLVIQRSSDRVGDR